MPEPLAKRTASTAPANTSESSRQWWSKFGPRDRWWLIGFAIFSLIVALGWKPARHQTVMALALRSDAPPGAVLSELVEGTTDRAPTLERMWRSGNLTVRQFVMEHLKTRLHTEPALVGAMEAIMNEATNDPDLNVREPAINILAEARSANSMMLLRQQLNDADPAVRVLALQQLQRVASSNDVPLAIHLLDDPDPRVTVQAALLLRKTTGLDFGIRSSHALPKFTRSEEAPLPPFNLDVIRRGAQEWREWWTQHRAEFPQPTSPTRIIPGRLPVKEFALEDSDGRLIHLSEFHGKAVLLCFWKIGNAASFDDVATLKQLQEQESRRLTVVGIAFDPAVGPQDDCGGEAHGGGHEHQHNNAHAVDSRGNSAATKPALRELVTRMSINHPVLLDANGSLVFRFNVQEVPTYALIDAQGNLRRRFAGARELSTWTAMVEEISSR
jgi:peroxiredoxin